MQQVFRALAQQVQVHLGLEPSTPVHKNKSNFRTTWTLNDFDVSMNWRYLDGVVEEPGGQAFLPAFSTIGSYSYFDLAGAGFAAMHHLAGHRQLLQQARQGLGPLREQLGRPQPGSLPLQER